MNLATKYRPKTFDEVVAQRFIKTILANQLETGEIRHAYLFTGGAGTGKTTSARIFAREANDHVGNPIEIDAASNTGVDNVRELIEDSRYRPIEGEYKVYIIDEVHMLSTGAFNALLKTLEEPPAWAIFILCTTDPQKIPATILSRVQRFDFTKIDLPEIVAQLEYIINQEVEEGADIEYDKQALQYIAKLANGGMRDAITRLEKVLDYTNYLTVEAVIEAIGAPNYSAFYGLTSAILSYSPKDGLSIIQDLYMSGKDLKLTIRAYADYLVDVCKYLLLGDIEATQLPQSVEAELKKLAKNVDYSTVLWLLEEVNKLSTAIKWEQSPKPIIDGQIMLLSQEVDYD